MKYLDKNKLHKYGFVNNEYITKLDNDYKVIITYDNNKLNVKVFDNYNEEYLPYYIKNNIGNFIASIKEKVYVIINDIYSKCEINNNIEDEIYKYVKEKYNTIPNKPFPNDDRTTTLKNDKEKWYGIIMTVKSSVLKIESEELIDIMNIKLDPEKIKQLIDNVNYFEAYHMNKKYWITILLDSNLDINKVKELIDESYKLVK